MATRKTPDTPQSPVLSGDQIRNRIARLERCIGEVESFDPNTVTKRFGDPQRQALEAAIDEALQAAFGHRTPAYNRYSSATSLDHGPVTMNIGSVWGRTNVADDEARKLTQARQYAADGKAQAIPLLQQAVRALNDQLAELEQTVAQVPLVEHSADNSKVFVVHGHDEALLQNIARFLEKVELEPIILREQPDKGLTIIEKFIEYAGQASFAVVLLTPDDLGGAKATEQQRERARQNVIFELGFFVGQLGRGRVCLMRKGAVEMPSDLSGVIYKTVDDGEGWKLELIKELKAAKLQLDANKMWS